MATVAAVIASTHHPFYLRASTATGDDRPPFADEWVAKIEAFRETLTRARPDVLRARPGVLRRGPGRPAAGRSGPAERSWDQEGRGERRGSHRCQPKPDHTVPCRQPTHLAPSLKPSRNVSTYPHTKPSERNPARRPVSTAARDSSGQVNALPRR